MMLRGRLSPQALAGVNGFPPPKYLKPGDEIISEIEGIGELVVRIGK